MPFTETLTPFFADFGVDGTLAGQPVRVIFDDPTEEALGGGAMVKRPQVQIATASVPANGHGAALVIPQGSYTVGERSDDGTGLTLLQLGKAAT